MRSCALVLALLVLPSLALAQADSIQVDHLKLRLGMSEAEVATAAGPELTLQRFADRVPKWATYEESHGVHTALVPASDPRRPRAYLTFEGGKLARVHRILDHFDSSDADSLVGSLLDALGSLGASPSAQVTVHTASWSDGRNHACFIEFHAGEKQVLLTSHNWGVQLVENLGRTDIPDVRIPR